MVPTKQSVIVPILGAVSGMTLIVTLIYCAFHTNAIPGKVTGFGWSRRICIEQYQTFVENSCSPPNGARILDSWMETYSYSTTSRDSKGNSKTTWHTGRRRRYKYEIDRWARIEQRTTQGNDHNPKWADVSDTTREVFVGAKREAWRDDSYNLDLIAEVTSYSYYLPLSEFEHRFVGEPVMLHINHFGIVRSYTTLESE